MDFKKIWKESSVMFVVKQLALAGVAAVILAWAALMMLDSYTNHGDVVTVPDLTGKYTEEAAVYLDKANMHYQVVDSMYDRSKPFGTVIEQTPPVGSTIKRWSTVYLIINSKGLRQAMVPVVRDLSYRQAEAMLKSSGFVIDSVVYTPSEYNNLVLDLRYAGASVEPGMQLPEESALTLVVGAAATENVPVMVPDLVGLSSEQARLRIMAAQFIVGMVEYDVPVEDNEAEYVVYSQTPQPGTWETSGKSVNLKLTLDKAKLQVVEEVEVEDEFF